MAEAVMVVCDDCGKPAVETVGIKINGSSRQKDVCAAHLAALKNTSRPATRGRPRKKGTVTGPARKARKTRKTAARK